MRSRPSTLPGRTTATAVAVLLLALLTVRGAAAQPAAPDPASCHPGFADFAQLHPHDWYQRLDPAVKPIADVQRLIGFHGLVVGFSDEQGNPGYTPRLVVVVAFHDGADLHAAGLPRVWANGKPVVVLHVSGIPQAALGPASPAAQSSTMQLPPDCPAAWSQGTDAAARLPSRLPPAGGIPTSGMAMVAVILYSAGTAMRGRRATSA